jgi:hypothetical protein
VPTENLIRHDARAGCGTERAMFAFLTKLVPAENPIANENLRVMEEQRGISKDLSDTGDDPTLVFVTESLESRASVVVGGASSIGRPY